MSHFLTILNAFAASWLAAFVRASWQGGLVIALLWLLCRLWPGLPPGPCCWLWRAAYVKLLLGLVCLPPLLLPILPATLSVSNPGPPIAAHETIAPSEEAKTPVVLVEPTAAPPVSVTAQPAPSALPSVQTYLLAAWLLGVFAGLGRVARAWQRTSRLYHTSKPLDDDALLTEIADLCRRFGLRRVPALRVTEELSSPILIGLLRPAILLPAFILADCSQAELRLMLAHEAAHLKRRDLVWCGLPVLARLLFFFHPLIWLTEHEWLLAQEIACDTLAVQVTQTPLSAYGRMLLHIAARRHAPTASLFPTLAVAAPRRTLHRRLFAMQHIGTASRPQIIVSAALLTALALGGLLPWRVVAQSKSPLPNPPVASQGDTTWQEKEQANFASQNAQLDAQIAELQKNLSPANRKKAAGAFLVSEAGKRQQHLQMLEQHRAAYMTAHPNSLTATQVDSVQQFNWRKAKPDRIREGIRWEQIIKGKLQAHLASAHDTPSRRGWQRQIAAIEHRRREGEEEIRDLGPVIARQEAQIDILPAKQRERVAKMRGYDVEISCDRTETLMEKQFALSFLRQIVAGRSKQAMP